VNAQHLFVHYSGKMKIFKVKKFVKSKMDKSAHDFDHVMRVYRFALRIAKNEKCDKEVVKLAALLHDVGQTSCKKGQHHAEVSASIANRYLKSIKYPKTKREKIVNAIKNHRFSTRNKIRSIEEKIIFDADKLDLAGVIGIVRCYYTLGYNKDAFRDVFRIGKKYLNLDKYFFTKTAKKLAKEKIKNMKRFVKFLEKELKSNP